MKKRLYLIIILLFSVAQTISAQLTERNMNPTVDYSRSPRLYHIGSIHVDGVPNYDENLLIGLSGLSVGQPVEIPGEDFTKAIKRYWKNGLFSNVSIRVDSIVNDSAHIHIQLTQRPRISQVNYYGLKKSERDEMKDKLGLVKDNQLTPNMIDRAKILAKRYFDDKGFKNADIDIVQRNDVAAPEIGRAHV